MPENPLIDRLEEFAVIPVIAIESTTLALPLADALIKGGLPVAEITFRTASAGEVIKILNKERPELLLGAGTILSVKDLVRAKEYGARFGVAPGFNPEIVQKAREISLPFFPGVMTPTEIEKGLSMGMKQMKYFPAEASGGVKMLKAISAPFVHQGVRFIPTGGISISNLADYLLHEFVLAAGGTWIASKAMISEKKWDIIENNARQAKDRVLEIRNA
ncbi:MAG: bifunctional 4-hydroxy-2-oxoglutarate aldolase/2-dehydro-3-deoxy-phosphogluconate aldolase [Deltaproteobacteria bacterium]|nr:bifunctional 4-hydroxy-2-oxoglutarate aldolase/2-dehydro-3-deoxy-phosphogluconate aldolase [Deltaproteobacteria bacterium]